MLERVLVIFLLFAFTGAHRVLIFGPWPERFQEEPESYLLRLSWILLYVPLVALILRHRRHILGVAWLTPGLTLLIVTCVASVLWSVSPADTLRRGFALVITAGFGYYLAARFDTRDFLTLLGCALTLAIVLSLIAGMLAPDVAVMQGSRAGSWRGLFAHKGALGRVATLNLLVVAVLITSHERRRLWHIGALLLAMVALVLSRSVGAMCTAVAVAAITLFIATLRARNEASVLGTLLLGSGVLISLAFAWIFLEEAFAVLDRDWTLTGRVWVWREAWYWISQNPFLGYGYGAFWMGPEVSYVEIEQNVGWIPGHAHNGYLDIWLQIGIVGLIVLFWSLLRAIRKIIARLLSADSQDIYWLSSAIFVILSQNLIESQLFRQNDIMTVLYVATIAMAAQIRRGSGR